MKLTKFDIYFGLLLAAASIVLPFLSAGEAMIQLLTLAAIWAIFAIGFDFVFGSLGMVSFGHATFLGVGGYAVALATQKYGLPFYGGAVLAIAVGAAFALLFSFFALLVSGIFFDASRYYAHPAVETVMQGNPAFVVLTMGRDLLLYQRWPAAEAWIQFGAWSFLLLGIGFLAFWRSEESYGVLNDR